MVLLVLTMVHIAAVDKCQRQCSQCSAERHRIYAGLNTEGARGTPLEGMKERIVAGVPPLRCRAGGTYRSQMYGVVAYRVVHFKVGDSHTQTVLV